MLTQSVIDRNIKLATGMTPVEYVKFVAKNGATDKVFSWTYGTPGHRFSGDPRRGLRKFLFDTQRGIDVETDKPLDWDSFHIAHIVSRGPDKRGFLGGNLMGVNATTNTAQQVRGLVVALDTLARPDLVHVEHFDMPFLTALGKSLRA